MEEQIKQQQMAADSYGHDSSRLFNELNKDQLLTMRNILHNLVFDEGARLAAYYEGVVVTTLNLKHNICPSCGTDHDAEAFAMTQVEIPQQREGERLPEDKLQQMLPTFDMTDEQVEQMIEYHLDDVRDEDTHQILGFICTGVNGQGSCGMRYPSIEDRMLRAPDKCSGCEQKSAWG